MGLPPKKGHVQENSHNLNEPRSLEKDIDTVSRHTMKGQAFLLGGLLSGVAASMLTLLAGP